MGAVELVTEHAHHLFTPFHLFTSLYHIARKCTLKRRNISPRAARAPPFVNVPVTTHKFCMAGGQLPSAPNDLLPFNRRQLCIGSGFMWLQNDVTSSGSTCMILWIQVKPWIETLASKKMELKHLCRLVELD
jgi:hypothetical protein